MNKYIALLMSFLIGFLSLSQEILWVRLLGFLSNGAPYILSLVLSSFLLGIALGAILGKKICANPGFSLRWVFLLWFFIGFIDLLMPEAFPVLMASDFNILLFMLLIVFSAALKACIFPVAHHLFTTSNEKQLGQSLSYVYLSNILGSTLGPLLVGFVLLDFVSLFDVFRLVGFVGLFVSIFIAIFIIDKGRVLGVVSLSVFTAISGWCVFGSPSSFSGYLNTSSVNPVVFVAENRQGIIHVVKDDSRGDIIYGGNVYDGRSNISLLKNTNLIDRVFMLSALHPSPKKVLVVGLSGGAWTKVLSGNYSIEKIDVVEINPGYLDYIKSNHLMNSILNDKRITINIDDGRRWLRSPDKRNYYDLIVINATFYWRAYSTNLLSVEMAELVKSSLAEGGIYAFNATGSKDAHYTVASVFNHSYRWSNFIYSAEHDFISSPDDIVEKIMKKYEGWDYDSWKHEDLLKIFSDKKFVSIDDELRDSSRPLEIIKDDNMIVEYKYGLRH
jgi:spermidine synthase